MNKAASFEQYFKRFITWDLRLEVGKFPMRILLIMRHSSYFFSLPLLAVCLLFPNYWITNNTSEFSESHSWSCLSIETLQKRKISDHEQAQAQHFYALLKAAPSFCMNLGEGKDAFALSDPFTEVNMTLKAVMQQRHMARSEKTWNRITPSENLRDCGKPKIHVWTE